MELTTRIFFMLLFIAIFFFCFFAVILINHFNLLFYSPKYKKKYSISILVPAYNEEDTIEATIRSIFNSNYFIKEIIVINDGSKDKTADVVKKLQKEFSRLKLIDKSNSGKADSLNQGIKIAEGELIGVVDADSYPSNDAIEKMVGFFNDKKVGAVTSCVFLKNKNTFFEKIQEIEYVVLAWTRKLLDFIDSVYVTNGPLSIYKKTALNEVGGFDKESITEDIEVTWHMLSRGYKTRMSLSSKVYTTVPNKFKKWWNQRVRWGQGGMDTIIKYKSDFLKKGKFGLFVIPFISFTIFLSVFTFIFSLYLIYKQLALNILYLKYSASLQNTLFNTENLNFFPTIMLILVAILFVISFFYSTSIFIIMGQKHIIKKERILNRMVYMLLYLSFYPLVWFASFYRVIRKKRKW